MEKEKQPQGGQGDEVKPWTLSDARQHYMSMKLFEYFQEWIEAGKPTRAQS